MSKIILLLITLVLLLGGCGHKGGLYLPDTDNQKTTASPSS